MKKTLLTLACCSLAGITFAQGTITIAESLYHNSVNYGAGAVALSTVANTYVFDVLQWTGVGAPTVNSSSDLLNAGWVDAGAYGANGTSTPTKGYISGSPTTVTSGNWNTGGTSYDIVVGWTSTEAGQNWNTIKGFITSGIWTDATSTGAFGYSAIGQTTAAISPAPAAAVFGSSPSIASAFILQNSLVQPVSTPEPSTMALAGLGGAAMLLFRRRK
jgi:PEP-CTERM motif